MIRKDGSWYWVSPAGEGCVPAKYYKYDDPYYIDDPGYFYVLGYISSYSEHSLLHASEEEITNLETIQFIESTKKLYDMLIDLYKYTSDEKEKTWITEKLEKVFENCKQFDEKDISSKISIKVKRKFFGDIPINKYFWYNGKRYKKLKTTIKIDNGELLDHSYVFIEK